MYNTTMGYIEEGSQDESLVNGETPQPRYSDWVPVSYDELVDQDSDVMGRSSQYAHVFSVLEGRKRPVKTYFNRPLADFYTPKQATSYRFLQQFNEIGIVTIQDYLNTTRSRLSGVHIFDSTKALYLEYVDRLTILPHARMVSEIVIGDRSAAEYQVPISFEKEEEVRESVDAIVEEFVARCFPNHSVEDQSDIFSVVRRRFGLDSCIEEGSNTIGRQRDYHFQKLTNRLARFRLLEEFLTTPANSFARRFLGVEIAKDLPLLPEEFSITPEPEDKRYFAVLSKLKPQQLVLEPLNDWKLKYLSVMEKKLAEIAAERKGAQLETDLGQFAGFLSKLQRILATDEMAIHTLLLQYPPEAQELLREVITVMKKEDSSS